MTTEATIYRSRRREGESIVSFVLRELKPKGGPWLTPFNLITGAIMATAAVLLVFRYVYGLGAMGDHSGNPWGLWVGFNVVGGVALAGGAYTLTFMVYVLGMDKYKPAVRATVLFGFLSYMFYAGALFVDLGRPWNVINPIIGNDFGFSSVLFLVAWHFLLYMTAQLIEFSPTIAEWLKEKKARRLLHGATLGAVVFGITLSLLHQSGLGALFLMAKPKIHSLWYSEFIPIQFLVSSIFAGLSVVILEMAVAGRAFKGHIDARHQRAVRPITIGLAKTCTGAMFAYLFLLALIFVHGHQRADLSDGYLQWYLLETVGLVLVPMGLFAWGAQHGKLGVIRAAAVMAVAGVLLNRLNVSIFTFKWYEAVRYWPSWMEITISLAVVCTQLWAFRWIGLRMPVRQAPPQWVHDAPETAPVREPAGVEASRA